MSKRIKTKAQAQVAREYARMRKEVLSYPPSAEIQSILVSFGVPTRDVYRFYTDMDIASESWYTPASVIMDLYNIWKERQDE